MKNVAKKFFVEESGQSMIEYVIIMALLVVAAIAVLGALGTAMKNKFGDVTNSLNSQNASSK